MFRESSARRHHPESKSAAKLLLFFDMVKYIKIKNITYFTTDITQYFTDITDTKKASQFLVKLNKEQSSKTTCQVFLPLYLQSDYTELIFWAFLGSLFQI